VWRDLSMDFIEGLPKSEGYSVILVAVDIFTKFAHFIPLKHAYTASSVASWTILSDYMAFPILLSLITIQYSHPFREGIV